LLGLTQPKPKNFFSRATRPRACAGIVRGGRARDGRGRRARGALRQPRALPAAAHRRQPGPFHRLARPGALPAAPACARADLVQADGHSELATTAVNDHSVPSLPASKQHGGPGRAGGCGSAAGGRRGARVAAPGAPGAARRRPPHAHQHRPPRAARQQPPGAPSMKGLLPKWNGGFTFSAPHKSGGLVHVHDPTASGHAPGPGRMVRPGTSSENVCAKRLEAMRLSGSARRGRPGPRARCPRLQRRATRPGGGRGRARWRRARQSRWRT